MYQFRFDIVWTHAPFILAGIPLTFVICLSAIALGLVLGLALGIARTMSLPVIGKLVAAYVEIFRNTPLLVQIVWFYYCLPIFFKTDISAIQAGVIAIGLNASAYLSEVFRGGIQAISGGQMEAGRSLGLSYGDTMRYIILPQAIRKMLPAFVNTFVVLIKESALVSYIGVLDVFHRGNVVTVTTMRPLEVYTTIALVYFILCYVTSRMASVAERRFVLID